MMMTNNRLEKVRNRARKLHEKYSLSVPVDLNTIISKKNITLEYIENRYGIDGWCKLTTSPPKIVVNSEITLEARRRFTIAHEIGHICIPWHTGVDCCIINDPYVMVQGQRLINTQEEEANTFASELLMPTDWLTSTFDLDTKDLKTLINSIRFTAKTSVMASFYALAHVMPDGNMFVIRTEVFTSWRVFYPDSFQGSHCISENKKALYDKICFFKNSFNVSQYEVIHYKLLPCPQTEVIRQVYARVGDNFENLLNTLSNYEPIRLILYLNTIVQALDDKYYVIVRLGDDYCQGFCHPQTSVRIRVDNIYDIDECYYYLQENFTEHGRIESEQFCLIWVKEVPVEMPKVFAECDHKSLLKRIVSELGYVESNERTHWIQKINGIISCIYTESKSSGLSKEAMYQKARIRFDTDPNLSGFVQHPDCECYLQSKISSLVKNSNNKK